MLIVLGGKTGNMTQYNNTLIKENNCYTLEANTQRNRAYLTLRGYWGNDSDLIEYISDISAGLQMLSNNFTLLIDLTYYNGTSPEMKNIHVEACKCAQKVGLGRVAGIFPSNPLAKMLFETYSKVTGINPMSFKNIIHAERWLDLY